MTAPYERESSTSPACLHTWLDLVSPPESTSTTVRPDVSSKSICLDTVSRSSRASGLKSVVGCSTTSMPRSLVSVRHPVLEQRALPAFLGCFAGTREGVEREFAEPVGLPAEQGDDRGL